VVPLGALVLPIVLSAVLVFVLSSLIHMVLGYHASDYTKLPEEDAVRAAIPAGQPRAEAVRDSVRQRRGGHEVGRVPAEDRRGPGGRAHHPATGEVGMGKALGVWFVYTLVVSTMVAYVGSATLPRGTDYIKVFQVVGTTGWLAYAFGQLPGGDLDGEAVVHRREGGLRRAALRPGQAGVFGWLWPR